MALVIKDDLVVIKKYVVSRGGFPSRGAFRPCGADRVVPYD